MREYDLLDHQFLSKIISLGIAVIFALMLLSITQVEIEDTSEGQLTTQDAYRSLVVIAQECKRYNDLEFPGR